METGAPRRELVGHTGRCFDSSLRCREGAETLIATASEDGTARVWGLDSGSCAGVLKGHVDECLRVAWAPRRVEEAAGAPVLATAGADGTARVWRGSRRCWERGGGRGGGAAAARNATAWDFAPTPIATLRPGDDGEAEPEQVYGCAWTRGGDPHGARVRPRPPPLVRFGARRPKGTRPPGGGFGNKLREGATREPSE